MRLLLLLYVLAQGNTAMAQLTADSISNYLIGSWDLCEYRNQVYYFDSYSGADESMQEHDVFSLKDTSLTFFANGTFVVNGNARRKKYAVDRLMKSYESPFKLVLNDTEYIFEIRDGGFILKRLILGTMDENESHSYFFERKGKCKHD